MGGTPSQIIDNITSNISNTINNTLQETCNNTNIQQSFTAKCNPDIIQQITTQANVCMNSFIPALTAGIITNKDIMDDCGGFLGVCRSSDIKFDQTITFNDTVNLANAIKDLSENDIKNNLTQFQNTKTNQTINNLASNIINIKSDIVQKVGNSVSDVQTLNADSYSFSNISFKQSATVITDTIMSNKVIVQDINSIANTISQTSMGTYSTILTIGAIIIALFILTFLIITMSKSKDLKDFLAKTIPYIIFVIVAFLITMIHIVLKPSYVTYKDTDGNVYLDKSKLLLYLSIYYISTIFLIVLVFYIRKKILGRSIESEHDSSEHDSSEHDSSEHDFSGISHLLSDNE
jgi:hypothetical protein